ncbi:MAG: hypothetical protein ACYDG2_24810 [Ruminiclostridium sp.]
MVYYCFRITTHGNYGKEVKQMFRNLRAEMARKGLSAKEIAAAIGMSEKALGHKLNGRSEFTRKEMCEIKNKFFNDRDLTYEYLFDLPGSDKKSA